jgi:hypothetical protein
MTDLQVLLAEKAAAVAIAQFVIDTGMLNQFQNTDPEAMGTYEEVITTNSPQLDTDVGASTDAHADDVSTRSARSSVRTSDDTNMSLGSRISELDNGDARSDETEDVSVQIGENLFTGDEEVNGCVRT